MYLVNLKGKTVEVDDENRAFHLIKKQGFKEATPEQIEQYESDRPWNINKPTPNNIFFISTTGTKDGYGESKNYIKKHLLKHGIILDEKYKNQSIGILYSYPYQIDFLKTPYRIIYTMFETDMIPNEWERPLKKADMVIVPARFMVPLFREHGVNVEVLPLGYDDTVFKPLERNRTEDDPFTFIHYDAFKYRKGYDLVIKAFDMAFKSNENVKLILKSTKEFITTNKVVLSVKTLVKHNKNIEVITDRLSHEDLAILLQRADCGVFPSRGEGFGLPPLETLATGITSIIPNAHGFSEYFNEKYFYETKVKEMIPAVYDSMRHKDVGQMWECDPESISKQMKYAFEHKEETKQKGIDGQKWVKENYTYDIFANKFKDLYENKIKKISNVSILVKKTIDIIVLTYNAIDFTKKCIESVKKYTKTPYNLIIIDNLSTDGTREYLKTLNDSNIKVILNNENKGVAGGRNQGIENCSADYIVFLDNDAEVGPKWSEMVLATFQKDKRIGIIGKRGEEVESLNPLIFANGVNMENRGVFEVDVVPGFFTVFKRSMIKQIGNQFDGMGTFWHEDLEFCIRAKRYGYKIVANTDIPIKHHEHRSVSVKKKITDEEIKKAYPGFEEKAASLEKRMIDNNTLTVYRYIHDDCHESFCLLADGFTNHLRDKGIIVYRKNSIHTKEKSFDICKCFEMKYCGHRFVTVHLENDIAPNSWHEEAKQIDYIFCASPHAYFGLKKSGFDENRLINYSLDGFDDRLYKVDGPVRTGFYDDYFKFLFVGATQPRKGLSYALKSYCETFTASDKVVFIIKDYAYGQKRSTEKLVEFYQTEYKKCPLIVYKYEDWTPEMLADTYRAVARNGAYIHPHKAECFGLPILEAIACGCRVGTTNFGGPKYMYNEDIVTYFDYNLEPSTFHNWKEEPFYDEEQNPRWARPNVESIQSFMKKAYSEKWIEKDAIKRSKFVTERYSYKTRAEKTFKIMKEVSSCK